MKTANIIITGFILLALSTNINAQESSEEENVKQVIEQLFYGMRSSDSSQVSHAFSSNAIMQTIARNKAGETVVNEGNLQDFLKAVGTKKEEVWDEQIASYEIKIDGELASAWTPYKFFIGDKFSHCGVNSFQLAKMGETWKIFHIVDTRRNSNCVEN